MLGNDQLIVMRVLSACPRDEDVQLLALPMSPAHSHSYSSSDDLPVFLQEVSRQEASSLACYSSEPSLLVPGMKHWLDCRRPQVTCSAAAGTLYAQARPRGLLSGRDWQFLLIGAAAAFCIYVAAQWASGLPVWRRLVQRFIWWKDGIQPEVTPTGMLLVV